MGPEAVDAAQTAPVDGTDPGERLVLAPVTVRHEVPLRTSATVLAMLADAGAPVPPEQTDAGRPTDQAITNEERALESGDENVV